MTQFCIGVKLPSESGHKLCVICVLFLLNVSSKQKQTFLYHLDMPRWTIVTSSPSKRYKYSNIFQIIDYFLYHWCNVWVNFLAKNSKFSNLMAKVNKCHYWLLLNTQYDANKVKFKAIFINLNVKIKGCVEIVIFLVSNCFLLVWPPTIKV